MPRKFLQMLIVSALFLLSACAEHKQYKEYFHPIVRDYFKKEDFGIQFMIKNTTIDSDAKSRASIRFFWKDSLITSGFPYSILLITKYSGVKRKTTKIISLKMKVENEQEIDLLNKNHDIIEIPYDPSGDFLKRGRIELPLDNKLSWWPGELVTFTMTFQPHNSKELFTMKYALEGRIERFDYTAWESMLAGP